MVRAFTKDDRQCLSAFNQETLGKLVDPAIYATSDVCAFRLRGPRSMSWSAGSTFRLSELHPVFQVKGIRQDHELFRLRKHWKIPATSLCPRTSPAVNLRMPVAKIRDVLKMLRADGWFLDRQTGSHRQFRHPFRKGTVTVNGHDGDTAPRWLVSAILKQAGLTKEDLK